MTREETIAIMGTMRAAFPAFYRDMSKDSALAVVSLWTEMFKDDSPALVAAAVKALIAAQVEGYPPTIGAVKEKMRQLSEPDELTAAQAWALVERACSNGLYGSVEEFAKLPPIVQKAVGTPNQLKEWAMMESDTVKSVVASNFQRGYQTMQKREREMALVPADVRAMLTAVADKLALPKGAGA